MYEPEGKEFKMVKVEPGSMAQTPTIRLPEAWAASLAVAIQECGIPAGKTYERGQLDSMRGHLEDMRQLVFKGKQPGKEA